MGLFLVLWWPLTGAAIHVWGCNKMKTIYGKPIWEDLSTYLMFIPAMTAGPFIIFAYAD